MAIDGRQGAPPALNGTAVMAFAYVSLVATAFSYVCLFTGFKYLPAGTVGMLGLLNPITGVLIEPPRVSRRLFGYSKTASLSALAS